MATKKKTKKKTVKKTSTKKSLTGFRKGFGHNVTFDELVHYIQADIKDREGINITLDRIKKVIYYLGGGIADNLGKSLKSCVSVPELGTFKTDWRRYKIGDKRGFTKTVKFTPAPKFKANAELGAK